MKKINFGRLALAVIGVELLGLSGSLFTMREITGWYSTLNKAFFNPPDWVFGPVWTILFLLMGISAYLIWQEGWKHKRVQWALGVFVWQFALNILWSALFFGLHNPGLALIEILFFWASIAWTIVTFNKISKPAAWILVPYIFWVSFATILNFAIVMLNVNL